MIDRIMSTLFKASENMRVTPGKQVDKTQQRPFTMDQSIAAEAREAAKVHRTPKVNTPEPTHTVDRQDQLSYVPLPLRSPVYENAHFYLKIKDLAAKTDANGQYKLIFQINTDTLGPLWFTLSTQPNLLSVQCITESNSTAELFRNSSLELQQDLSEAGYQNVIVSCRIQPGIRGIADIDPDFAASEGYLLLNVQV
ncbi:flagellar hook-length control protein FliK [Desulfotomaculum sp. 1211_IL3151]|uniref:flagellar hook-length control protein FliK n=1 Tax=Desulfotomaculum sp. 1211_IL3151 TaxID=3084055 RepID=UPI002FDA1E50